jgi:hypothetical protein
MRRWTSIKHALIFGVVLLFLLSAASMIACIRNVRRRLMPVGAAFKTGLWLSLSFSNTRNAFC